MLLVTGAAGYVGGAALRQISTLGGSRSVVGLARNAESAAPTAPNGVTLRIADYDDRPSLDKAFQGATRLLFVASDGAGPDVVRQQAHVIDAAAGSGVEHIVFTSIIDVDETSPFYFAAVLASGAHRGQVYELIGPKSYSFDEIGEGATAFQVPEGGLGHGGHGQPVR